ncbi:hypothetical protein [Bradyrhizobium zhanjiangense]|uniref:hypothetical protein n=1 Tax=Bradyrhizobium zhanjiangense TaxID=1325107 RepID=UPI0013E8C0B6|nr:hypothetical protein [Bradyrhizobium zhanjiangense]
MSKAGPVAQPALLFGLERLDLGRAFPELYYVPIDKLLGAFPCSCFVAHIEVNPQFYVSIGTDVSSV